jgi:hypothetical protein
LRTAAISGLAFTVLYVVHRLLCGASPAAGHRTRQLHRDGTPVVWTIGAMVAALSLAIYRTGLVGRWLGVAGLVAAVIFLLGSVFSVLGPTPEGSSSLVGVGLFIVWMLVLSVALWRASSTSTTPGP